MPNLDVTKVSTKELLSEYNAAARFLGEREVNKFTDRATAERRTQAIIALAEETRNPANVTLGQTQPVSTQVTSASKEAPKKTLEEVLEDGKAKLAESAPPASSSTPRWARPKEEAASKVAYRPRPKTVQEFIYGLLTREGGIAIEEFCSTMQANGYKDKSWLAPAGVWTGLRYLFVSLRGYGLKFDGKMLSLIVPADERAGAPEK